ncbi:oxygen-independent coproporphyrinogen III oxidase [Iodobacter fluviatilis]|uniref:Coproporphyrinogen-III oxidase n=1 Tax=Iodobacter fluviatilis TaxID=537 RepID=A0A377Q8K0_9NEIS|nr:oxygen-independent coproporphyrinogen III oxidase [Iodobacter fluviatilis]TCU88867.1 oxygen-independent coproporphyrinogen-3 oxidase [Iodobacter fluviatilis]STQ91060.1 Oxygen-independent coproporphyrinogen-III oxidase [Iodobacter fluviatilis]
MLQDNVAVLQPLDFDRNLISQHNGKGPRYTSYPTADRFAAMDAHTYEQSVSQQQPGTRVKPLSLYFHLPFCNTICYYCACNKVITKDQSKADQYLNYLLKEVKLQSALLTKRGTVSQLHFGGGTPTFLTDDQLSRLMDGIRTHFDLKPDGEFSIEIDPRKVSAATVAHLGAIGFNRMSVGIQDFNLEVQQAVNRVQSEEETSIVIDAARANGFKSVSIDLIYGLPHQSQASMHQTIEKVISLRPDRLALYSYAHLPERFMPQRRIDAGHLPTTEGKLDILQSSVNQLLAAGYIYIGMDHFSLPDDALAIAQRRGQLHRNFQGYSTHADCDLMAFGVSAIGKVANCFAQNVKDLDTYYQVLDTDHLPVERGLLINHDDFLRGSVIQSLMCQFELSFQPVELSYLIDFKSYFAEELKLLAPYEQDGLLVLKNDSITITAKGRFLVRSIAMVFDRYLRHAAPAGRYSKLI